VLAIFILDDDLAARLLATTLSREGGGSRDVLGVLSRCRRCRPRRFCSSGFRSRDGSHLSRSRVRVPRIVAALRLRCGGTQKAFACLRRILGNCPISSPSCSCSSSVFAKWAAP